MRRGSLAPVRQALWSLLATSSLAAQSAQAGTSDVEAALEAWRASYGPNWELEVDPETRLGSFLWGGLVPPDGDGAKSDSERIAFAFQLAELSRDLHGLDSKLLVLDRCVFLPLGLADTSDKTAVRLRQEKNGVRVVHGFLNFLLAQDGTLLAIESTGIAALDTVDTTPTVTDEMARARAIDAFTADVGLPPKAVSTAELVIEQVRDKITRTRIPKLAWHVAAVWEDAEVRPEAYRYTIDAHTAEVIARQDVAHSLDVSGHVTSIVTAGYYPPDHPSGGSTEEVDMPRIAVNYVKGLAVGTVWTDENGNFTIPNINPPVTVSIGYNGLFTNVNNQSAGDYTFTPPPLSQSSGNEVALNPASVDELAQSNAYRWVNALRQWIGSVNPADTTAQISGAEIRVNAGGSAAPFPLPGCLGNYNGGNPPHILLYKQGSAPCFNGSFASSIVHEMGHWLNDLYGIENPTTGMGEGNADIFSMYLLGVPEIAPGISNQTGFEFIRTGENSRRYCGDKSRGCYQDKHADAWPLMGAFWKMRQRLIASQGETNGALIAAVLHNAWINTYVQTEIGDSVVMKLLLLDLDLYDNDNDVRDGTPHYADITRGFMEQGWPDMLPGGISFANVSPQPTGYVVNHDGPHSVTVDVEAQFYPPLATQNPVRLFYRVNGGGFVALAPSTVQGSTYGFLIPGPGTTPAKIDYYLTATDSAGQSVEFPPVRRFWRDGLINSTIPDHLEKGSLPTGEGDFFFYSVGDRETLFTSDMCSGCESDFDYFEHRQPTDGWDFIDPLGLGGETPVEHIVWEDPDSAFSGTFVWAQDSVELSQPHPSHRIGDLQLRTSGAISLSNVEPSDLVFLRFRRWLTVDRAEAFAARVVAQFGSRAELLWENHRRIPHVDYEWVEVHINISDTISGERCISWINWSLDTINPINTDRLGGWNIDDVEVYRVGALQ